MASNTIPSDKQSTWIVRAFTTLGQLIGEVLAPFGTANISY